MCFLSHPLDEIDKLHYLCLSLIPSLPGVYSPKTGNSKIQPSNKWHKIRRSFRWKYWNASADIWHFFSNLHDMEIYKADIWLLSLSPEEIDKLHYLWLTLRLQLTYITCKKIRTIFLLLFFWTKKLSENKTVLNFKASKIFKRPKHL